MSTHMATAVTVVQPGDGEEVRMPGFGAVFKLRSTGTGGEIAIVEHPFAVGTITAPHPAHPRGRALHCARGPDREQYGLTYGQPDWLADVIERFRLTPPTH